MVTIDKRTALIVIDLQKGIAALPLIAPIAETIGAAAGLAREFRAQSLPVFLVTVEGAPTGRTQRGASQRTLPEGWADLLPELQATPQDWRIAKHAVSAFGGTDLAGQLSGLGITQVVICGISTSMGVEGTARDAFDLGLNVLIARDAVNDGSAEAHEHSFSHIFPRIAEVATSGDISEQLKCADRLA
jgi:nicotinamidase-related amidase